MTNSFKCEFFTLRYVPDLVKGEFVNIGVVLRDAEGGFADVKLTDDWRRARCLDADVDVEGLQALEGELRHALRSRAELDQVFLVQKLPDWASNALQLTPMQAVLTDSPQMELGRLTEMYCEAKRGGKRQLSGRQVILNTMRDTFVQADVWNLMWQEIAVERYTYWGDPLRIDCGYKSNGTVQLFQAVSLTSDITPVKGLAFSYPDIMAGIARVEGAKTVLTAIVEDGLDRSDKRISFAINTLEQANIVVHPTSMLPAIAQIARTELRV